MIHTTQLHMAPFLRLILCLLMVVSIALPPLLWSATYRCEDSSGISVLTDSRAQLENCALLLNDPPKTQASSRHKAFPSNQSMDYSPKDLQSDQELEIEEASEDLSEPSHNIESQSQESSTITVPVTPMGGSLVLPVRLNDEQTVQLILDTGATMMVLSTDVAIQLGLLSGSQNQISTVNTAGGSIQVNMTHLKTVQVGSAKANNVAVAIHDLPDTDSGIDGLLGMSYLDNFLVTLDTKQKELHLRPR